MFSAENKRFVIENKTYPIKLTAIIEVKEIKSLIFFKVMYFFSAKVQHVK
ncbi:hypothetical protein GCM10022271_14740 [Corallibacter vietnamensis]|uniref:Uncharacterized protein n=1 Tax=Corallibacter vietnamensis TaxID=904130 RepID=A0ABP7HB04_9FLAO